MITITLVFIARYVFNRYFKMDVFEAPEEIDCISKHTYGFKCDVVLSRLCDLISKYVSRLHLYFEQVAKTHSSVNTLNEDELDDMESKVQQTLDNVLSLAQLYVVDCVQHAEDNKASVNDLVTDCMEQAMEFHAIKNTWHTMVQLNGFIDKGLELIANMNMFDDYLDDHYDEAVLEINRIYQLYFRSVCDELELLDERITAVGMNLTDDDDTLPKASRAIVNDMSLYLLERVKILRDRCNSASILIRKFRV